MCAVHPNKNFVVFILCYKFENGHSRSAADFQAVEFRCLEGLILHYCCWLIMNRHVQSATARTSAQRSQINIKRGSGCLLTKMLPTRARDQDMSTSLHPAI